MSGRRHVWYRERSTWLAIFLCSGLLALGWFGYRAIAEWQRSSAQLIEYRSHEAADLLMRALMRDMSGAQMSVLNNPEQNQYSFEAPYDIKDLVAGAFARYPYPEVFFGWTGSSPGTVVFSRTDRKIAWLSPGEETGLYPVKVSSNPPQAAALRARIEGDIAARRRYAIFELPIGGATYQVVTLLSYQDRTREQFRRAFGFAVNLEWARAHYFDGLIRQVLQIDGHPSEVRFAISDEAGRNVAGAPADTMPSPAATRSFPVLFFDPALVGIDPPTDFSQRSWVVAASAAADPTFALAVRGARRSLIVVGIGVAVLALSLLATLRAVRASAALAAVRADFVATVTHELKTPLATIRAVGETFVRDRAKTDTDRKLYARMLVREERRLTRLVNNLLAYSRVTDVTQIYSFESQNPASLVSEALQGFRRQLSDSEFRLDVTMPADIPSVRADRTALVLALDNLIDNAIRYSGTSRAVAIRASATDDHVRFDVVDQGVGISDEELPQVQRPFVRGRAADSTGNGIGLAIVHRIASDHDGMFQLSSQVGIGTTASLLIPRASA